MYLSSLKSLCSSNICVLYIKDFAFWHMYRIFCSKYWRLYSPNDLPAISYSDFKTILLCLIAIKLEIGGLLAIDGFKRTFSTYQVPPYLQKIIEYIPRQGIYRILPFLLIEVVLSPELLNEVNKIRDNNDLAYSLGRLNVIFAKNKMYFEEWTNSDSKNIFVLSDFLHTNDDELQLNILDSKNIGSSVRDVSEKVTLYTSNCYTSISVSLAVCLLFSLTVKNENVNSARTFFGSKFCCLLSENSQYQILIMDSIFKLIGPPNTIVDQKKMMDQQTVPPRLTNPTFQSSPQKTITPKVGKTISNPVTTTDIIKLFKVFLNDFVLKNNISEDFNMNDIGGLFPVRSP